MFCVVIFGLVGLVKIDPDISDEALMKVVEQTLHLDMEPACAGCLGQAAGQRISLGTSPVLLDDAKIVYSSATTFSAWRSRDRYPVVL